MDGDPDEIDEQAIREVVRDELAQQAGSADGVQDSSNEQNSGGWSRRDTLLGALGLAGGAALPSALQGSVGTAQAQTAVGQVGTSSERLDVYGATVDSEVVSTGSATIDGSTALRSTDDSAASPSFGSWVEISSSRPSIVIAEAFAETDGTTSGRVRLEVDTNGDGTQDYDLITVEAPPEMGAGALYTDESITHLVPGSQYRLFNEDDPNGNNGIRGVRHVIL